jgi:hypothetical protein
MWATTLSPLHIKRGCNAPTLSTSSGNHFANECQYPCKNVSRHISVLSSQTNALSSLNQLFDYLRKLFQLNRSRDSAVGIPTGSMTKVSDFESQSMSSRPALGPIQPPTERVSGALSSGVKWPGREADHSPPTSVAGKKMWIYTSTPSHRDNFLYFLLYFQLRRSGNVSLHTAYHNLPKTEDGTRHNKHSRSNILIWHNECVTVYRKV